MAKVSIRIPDLHACSIEELDFTIRMLQKEKAKKVK